MKPTRRPLPLLLFTALLAAPGAHAGSMRFLPVNGEVAERKIGLRDGGEVIPLRDLDVRKRSKVYTTRAGETVTLEVMDRERPGGQPATVEVPLAEGIADPLVVIFPDAEAAAGLRVVVLEDDTAGFSWGTLRFINAADMPLTVRCEASTAEIRGTGDKADVAPGGEARNIGVQVTKAGGENTVLYSAVWEHDPNLRKLVLIVPAADPEMEEVTLATVNEDQRTRK